MLKSIASVGATKIVALAVTFLATLGTIRIITTGYGFEAYGAVSLVATIVAFMPIADLGLGIGLTNSAARSTTLRTSSSLRLSLSTVLWLLLGTASIVVAAGAVLAAVGAWPHILGPSSQQLGDANAFMPWFMVLCGLWVISGASYRVLVGQQRVNTMVTLQATGPVLAVALAYIGAQANAPLLLFAFLPISGSLLASAAGWILALRAIPFGLRRPIPPTRIGRDRYVLTLKHALSGLLFTLGGLLLFAFDRVLLSNLSTATALSIYATAITLYTAAQSGLGSIGAFLWPYYTRLRLERRLTKRLIAIHSLYFVGVGLAAGAIVWAIYPAYFWFAGVRLSDPLMAPLVGLAIAIQAALLPATSSLTLPSQLRAQGVGLFGALIVKLALCAALIPIMGAPAVLLASVCGVVLVQTPIVAILVMRRRRPEALV